MVPLVYYLLTWIDTSKRLHHDLLSEDNLKPNLPFDGFWPYRPRKKRSKIRFLSSSRIPGPLPSTLKRRFSSFKLNCKLVSPSSSVYFKALSSSGHQLWGAFYQNKWLSTWLSPRKGCHFFRNDLKNSEKVWSKKLVRYLPSLVSSRHLFGHVRDW